jgi:hypothetical protein
MEANINSQQKKAGVGFCSHRGVQFGMSESDPYHATLFRLHLLFLRLPNYD